MLPNAGQNHNLITHLLTQQPTKQHVNEPITSQQEKQSNPQNSLPQKPSR